MSKLGYMQLDGASLVEKGPGDVKMSLLFVGTHDRWA